MLADKILLPATLHAVDTLAARLQWVLTQTGLSARGLSLKAGLADGHVGLILRGTVGKRLSDTTIAALAKAGGVSSEWLARGVGEPRFVPTVGRTPPLRIEHTERYAGRKEASDALQGLVEPEAITTVGAWDLNATQDPGALWWIERIKEADRQLKHWRKNPSAERAELEKRQADGDALEAEERAHMAAAAGKPRPENDAAGAAGKSKGKP